MAPITINGNTWDPGDPQNGPAVSPDAQDTNFIILHTREPLQLNQFQELRDAGATLRGFVDRGVYLAHYTPADLETLRTKPYLQHVDVYHPFFALHTDLRAAASVASADGPDEEPRSELGSTDDKTLLAIDLHQGCDPQQLLNRMISQGIIDPDDSDLEVRPQSIVANVDSRYFATVAAIEEVFLVQKQLKATLAVNMSRGQINLARAMPLVIAGTPGETILDGSGETINIVDTGFNQGLGPISHAFSSKVPPTPTNGWLIEPTYANGLIDKDGHGTHVAGCAVGNGPTTDLAGPLANTSGRIQGTAPGANWTFVQLTQAWNAGVTPQKPVLRTGDPFANYVNNFLLIGPRCRVSNHSYGYRLAAHTAQLPYNAENIDLDSFVQTNPQLVVCWAAGNDGLVPSTSGGQVQGWPASKNIITVGSTQNLRPADANGDYLRTGTWMDPFGVATTSSQGPTFPPNRIKPDVCAPGDSILSAYSDDYWDAANMPAGTHYVWDSGTSMSSPSVAGCAAVLRQALDLQGVTTPSATLIKALLVNGAVDIQRGTGASPTIPNNFQGFGRVNMKSSLEMILPPNTPTPQAGYVDTTLAGAAFTALAYGNANDMNLTIPAAQTVLQTPPITAACTLKVTLTWLDTPSPGGALQDCLALYVRASDATWKYGNDLTAPQGGALDPTKFDPTNNVQQVLWEGIPPGAATVTVSYHTAADNTRLVNYALAWSIE